MMMMIPKKMLLSADVDAAFSNPQPDNDKPDHPDECY
jgi:hypothetical protein